MPVLTPKKAGKRPIVVHLGNVSGAEEKKAAKTKKYAARFRRVNFRGIDLEPVKEGQVNGSWLRVSNNWRQLRTDFKVGLEKLRDNSVSLISSDMALGYYHESGAFFQHSDMQKIKPTADALNVAYRKLKKGGKIMFTVGNNFLQYSQDALKQTPFEKQKIIVRPLTGGESGRTPWTKAIASKDAPVFQIIAQK